MKQIAKKYIHVDNGGIEVDINESEYGDYSITIETSYYGYPFIKSSLSGLTLPALEEITSFLNKEVSKLKLKR